MAKSLTHLSLFSGIGGIDLAAEWAGFQTVAFCENNSFCQRVLNKHWPNEPIYDDIRTLNGLQYKNVTLITGGFPCQPFSAAGNKAGEEDARFLWPEMLRVIREAEPRWIVGENVTGITNMVELENICSSLEASNYEVQTIGIPATAVGARQRRPRIFIVAHVIEKRGKRLTPRLRKEIGAKLYAKSDRVCNDSSIRRTYFELEDIFPIPLSAVRRKNDGVPSELDEIRGLGNAVIPQQIYPILKSIALIEGIR